VHSPAVVLCYSLETHHGGERPLMQPTLITKQISSRRRDPPAAIPTSTVGFALLGLVLVCVLLALIVAPGCVNTPEQLAKWDHTYADITNGIAQAQPVIQNVVPAPWNAVAEAALGLISAGLTTWNLQQHRRIAALEAAATPTAPNAPARGSP
jgi:hypothetical protein